MCPCSPPVRGLDALGDALTVDGGACGTRNCWARRRRWRAGPRARRLRGGGDRLAGDRPRWLGGAAGRRTRSYRSRRTRPRRARAHPAGLGAELLPVDFANAGPHRGPAGRPPWCSTPRDDRAAQGRGDLARRHRRGPDALAAAWQWTADRHPRARSAAVHVHGLVLACWAPASGSRWCTPGPTPVAYAAAGGSLYFGVPTVWHRGATGRGRRQGAVRGPAAVSAARRCRPGLRGPAPAAGHEPVERYG